MTKKRQMQIQRHLKNTFKQQSQKLSPIETFGLSDEKKLFDKKYKDNEKDNDKDKDKDQGNQDDDKYIQKTPSRTNP